MKALRLQWLLPVFVFITIATVTAKKSSRETELFCDREKDICIYTDATSEDDSHTTFDKNYKRSKIDVQELNTDAWFALGREIGKDLVKEWNSHLGASALKQADDLLQRIRNLPATYIKKNPVKYCNKTITCTRIARECEPFAPEVLEAKTMEIKNIPRPICQEYFTCLEFDRKLKKLWKQVRERAHVKWEPRTIPVQQPYCGNTNNVHDEIKMG